ncbi:hypothetical protein RJT34_06189 [Clitoria ternatea]|uniref:Transmembrane protein n=1 Tax=Clitoria ternatea TaxID=43366 RepID=A0AAN9K412_CLITE
MTGEEISGPPGPKLIRLIYFVGAGVICTAAINKWRDYEKKTIIQQQQQQAAETQKSSESVVVREALK